jgi:hypothetical protein
MREEGYVAVWQTQDLFSMMYKMSKRSRTLVTTVSGLLLRLGSLPPQRVLLLRFSRICAFAGTATLLLS